MLSQSSSHHELNLSLQNGELDLCLREITFEGQSVVRDETFVRLPFPFHLALYSLAERRPGQWIGHGEREVIDRQRSCEPDGVQQRIIGLSGITQDEERPGP